MIPRGAPHIAWSDLLAAAAHSISPGSAVAARCSVESLWGPNAVATLSVRTGLDALLQVLAFPPGSEIIMSAITIPHVVDIIAHHKLVAVPVDIDLQTLEVDEADVRAAVTSDTRAVLVAHLFGSRMPLDDIAALAREQKLMLLEDCAQAYDGSDYRGHPESDVAMFSFGLIKRSTALGGGLLRFKDGSLAERVRQKQSTYPHQTRRAYLRRVLTMTAIKTGSLRPVFGLFIALCRLRGKDHDQAVGTALRAFSGGDLFARLRQQPSAPLMRVLKRRLRQPARKAVAQQVAIVNAITMVFPNLTRPGANAARHTHWIVPMMTPDPDRLMRHLWTEGFDATRGASNLLCVAAPPGRPNATNAARLMAEVLYLPVFPSATADEMRELARAVRDFETAPRNELSLTTTQ